MSDTTAAPSEWTVLRRHRAAGEREIGRFRSAEDAKAHAEFDAACLEVDPSDAPDGALQLAWREYDDGVGWEGDCTHTVYHVVPAGAVPDAARGSKPGAHRDGRGRTLTAGGARGAR